MAGQSAEHRAVCVVPGCARSASSASEAWLGCCDEHRARFDAQADEEAWGYALSILNPWLEATRQIGSPELTRIMERAVEEADQELNRTLDRLEEAGAAL